MRQLQRPALTVFLVGALGGTFFFAAGPAAQADTREAPPRSGVVTLLDYFEMGRRAVSEFVSRPETRRNWPELGGVIERSRQVCARVEVRIDEGEDAYRSIVASGVLIDGRKRILTAGHAFADVEEAEIVVTFPNSESHNARLLDSTYVPFAGAGRDWAVLELEEPLLVELPEVELATARTGGLAVILGYPDEIGVNYDGETAYATNFPGELLQPLTTLATVSEGHTIRLGPEAGALPLGGMSGGPVFDARGRLIGIFVSIVRASTQANVEYTYHAAPVDAIHVLGQLPSAH